MATKKTNLPKNDKRQLFFDRNRKNYIEFDLEQLKTCQEIYNSFHEEIDKNISAIYSTKNNNKSNFNFILMHIRTMNKSDTSTLIEVKLDLESNLSDILINKQYFLCYLPKNAFNIDKKRKVRNKLNEDEFNNDRFKGVERETLSDHELEKYLSNEGVYYFDKEKVEFLYGKGNITEKKININYKKTNIDIFIDEIKKDEYFENKVPTSIEFLTKKCPNFIFQIHQNNVTHILGLYKQKSYLIWKNAINMAKIKNNNTTIDSSFNTNIFTYNYLLFVKRESIPRKCYIINQILENSEKRQIFLDEYKDKKISDIANNIISYKTNIKNNKFFDAWLCLKQISFYIDFNNIKDNGQKKREKEKYVDLFTPERIEIYSNTVKKVNEAIKKIKNYEEEMNNVLKSIFKIDLFDSLYSQIYELYILPYFQKVKDALNKECRFDQKPELVQKFHLLMARYCANYFDMKNLNNYNYLCPHKEGQEDENNNNQNNIRTNSNDSSNNDKNNNNKENNSSDNKNSDSNDNSQTQKGNNSDIKSEDNINS